MADGEDQDVIENEVADDTEEVGGADLSGTIDDEAGEAVESLEGEDNKEAKPANADEEKPGHNFSKGLQDLQQRQAATDRKLDELLATIKGQGGKATQAQIEQVEDLKEQAEKQGDVFADLQKYADMDPDDFALIDPNVAQSMLKGILALRAEKNTAKQEQETQAHQAAVQTWATDYASRTGRDEATVSKMLTEHEAALSKHNTQDPEAAQDLHELYWKKLEAKYPAKGATSAKVGDGKGKKEPPERIQQNNAVADSKASKRQRVSLAGNIGGSA
jgi:hypothetical protein